ncbi:MAG: hypothetical protein HPY83_19405 [Anaerolineae bacterium]|nr:hypothetical protein [Anaerolineae bacterium]
MSPLRRLSLRVEQVRELSALADVGEIARRYFAMNAFDGVLTIIGVLVGSYTAGIADARIVLTTGFATSLAMGVSGLWGAALTESAERKRSLNELEQATLCDLGDTRLARAGRVAVVIVTLADALAPVAASALVLMPLLLAPALGGIRASYFAALGVGLGTLFGLGMFLGRISRSNLALSGLKTVSAGLVSILVGLALHPAAG